MTEDLFCSLHVDARLDDAGLAALVAELTGGQVERRVVVTPWARLGVDADFGDAEIRAHDPDSHLGWRAVIEVMPSAGRPELIDHLTALIRGLVGRGFRVLAHADYADELPGAGEVIGPGTS